MSNEKRKIPINDLTGLGTFLEQNHIPLSLLKQHNGKVIGEAPATQEVFELMAEFQANPEMPILDFLAHQRRLRGRMLDMRDGNEMNGNAKREKEREYGQRKI